MLDRPFDKLRAGGPTPRLIDLTHDASPWSLIHGEALDVLRGLPNDLADSLIVDPPYSSGGIMGYGTNSCVPEPQN
jgi:hypothetical protein